MAQPRLISTAILIIATMIVSAQSAAAQKSLSRDALKGQQLRVRGCAKPGVEAATVVLDHVAEVAPDGTLRPPVPRGLPTAVYSFNDASRLLPELGHMVDVRGKVKQITDAEIEIKPEPARDDEPIAEIQRPGRDVKATLDEVPVPVATAGTYARLKTVVLEIDVDSVTRIADSCPR